MRMTSYRHRSEVGTAAYILRVKRRVSTVHDKCTAMSNNTASWLIVW